MISLNDFWINILINAIGALLLMICISVVNLLLGKGNESKIKSKKHITKFSSIVLISCLMILLVLAIAISFDYTNAFDLFQVKLNFYKYYIVPFIFTTAFFYIQISHKNNFALHISLPDTFTVFSMTLSTEYLLFFLFYDSMPDKLAISDKVIIFVGIIYTYISILDHYAKGTWLGKYTSTLLNRNLNKEVVINPVSNSKTTYNLDNELLELNAILDVIKTGSYNDIIEALNKFTMTGQSFLFQLQNFNLDKKTKDDFLLTYDNCNKKIIDYLDYTDYIHRDAACLALSAFVGKIKGMNILLESAREVHEGAL